MVERVVGDPGVLAERLAQEVERAGRRAIDTRGRFAIALSGGSVATMFFPRLATIRLDWSRVAFFWADERAVAPDDPESNYGVARALWLDPAHVPAASVHRMTAESADPDSAAAAYADILERVTGRPPHLDVAILGIGPDGHVASLFPGHPQLAEMHASVAVVRDSPKPPPVRMTLTRPVLAAAGLVVIGAFGAGKASIVREAFERPDSPLPVAIVAREASRVLLLVDEAAASVSPARNG